MAEVDPKEFGQLVGEFRSLVKSYDTLAADVGSIKQRLDTGKGILWGAVVASAGVGGSVGAIAHKLMDVIK